MLEGTALERLRPSRESGGVNLLLLVPIVIALLIAGWWFLLREPPLKPGELRVTFEHGESCRWQDWTFRIRRQNVSTRARGNMLTVGPGSTETHDETWLRVYSPSGEPMNIHPSDLRQMTFTVRAASSGSNRVVQSLELVTVSGTTRFEPVELPRFSRSRVMVPVASRFWPDQSDDYMSWGNVRMTLAGTVPASCSTDDEISLTRPEHRSQRTPILIEFGY